MSLLNTRDSEASRRGKKSKIKTQDFQLLFALFSVMIPRTMVQFQDWGEGQKRHDGWLEKNMVDLEGNTGSLRRPGSQPGFSLVWKHRLGSPELDLRMLSKFKIVYFILKC